MRLGIDIDGTITTAYYWLEFFNRHFNTQLEPKDVQHYDHHIDLGIDLKTFKAFRLEHLTEIHQLAQVREAAAQIIEQLYHQGHEIFLITAREKQLKFLTRAWLKDHKIPYHRLFHLGSTDKAGLAKTLGIELFFEDRLETALSLTQAGIPTLLFETSYNQGPDHPYILRIDSWREANWIVQKLMGSTHHKAPLSDNNICLGH